MNETEVHASVERRARRIWVSVIVGLLGIQVLIGAVSIHLATNDQSAAVVPNYHQAALDWDQTKQAALAASRNGWRMSLTTSDVADGRGMRAVELVAIDADRRPIESLVVTGQVYHHAVAGQVESIEFRSVGDGRYLAMAPMARRGLWQINLNIQGADEAMTLAQSFEAR